ncbi:uncharacterized protein F4822DRAFT_439996 [Hypoxylon trugodes]|uniref:uncharacterized protein n=1 Tax=Hypoxylon trugodes TaxID=326681 RepID=UPI0021A07133|nr:uncharacterized protein F4822DRAFT_439996 [Hypoxylon trugodes]KAI1383725.1 hypothetical protein F4822DRAFT_439996 [Hypoxylon trugodes]
MASEPTLTFGVELEFLIATNSSHENNKETYETMASLFLENLANPLPCACIQGKWSKYKDSSVVGSKDSTTLQAEGKSAVGLEVSTRVLKFDKQGCPEFRAAFTAITKGGHLKNNNVAGIFKPVPTQNAAVHVHIGVENGLDLDTAKKAVALGWLLEPCLFSLCSGDRGRLTHAPIRKYSVLANKKIAIEESDAKKELNGDGVTRGENGIDKNLDDGVPNDTHKDIQGDSNIFEKAENTPRREQDGEDVLNQKDESNVTHGYFSKGGKSRVTTQEEVPQKIPELGSCNLPIEFSTIERKRISTILAAKDMYELEILISSTHAISTNRRLSLAIYNREDDHTTIEFRHFQSTMDNELAWRWVRITAAIVQTASKPKSEYSETLQFIAKEYDTMKLKWTEHIWDRTFRRETTDPWLNSWQWMLILLDLEDDIPFWRDHLSQLPERNRTT